MTNPKVDTRAVAKQLFPQSPSQTTATLFYHPNEHTNKTSAQRPLVCIPVRNTPT